MIKLASLDEIIRYGKFEEFKSVIAEAFGARGFEPVEGLFEKLKARNLPNLILSMGANGDGTEAIKGTVVRSFQETDAKMHEMGLEAPCYVVVDVIAVHPAEQDNGVMKALMMVLRMVTYEPPFEVLPTVWRTSSETASKKYEKSSDFGNSPAKVYGYDVHGFGFYDNGKPLYPDPRKLFEHMAGIVANKEKNFVPKKAA
ncbi:hypothetical protein J4458_00860 [Candidatus Woesearchaeota archaeon]|nr:hypothetical protein [Candidatus Woesearchaeota archaeon]